jgi:hypothetical protein
MKNLLKKKNSNWGKYQIQNLKTIEKDFNQIAWFMLILKHFWHFSSGFTPLKTSLIYQILEIGLKCGLNCNH